MNRTEELKNCTHIKTILMLIIVLYHSMVIYGEETWGPFDRMLDAPILGRIAEWLNSFHVYAFTLISGYIFCYIKYEKRSYHRYLPFLGNKVKRLLVPYMFVSVIWVAPVHAYFFGINDLVSKYVLGTAPSQLWFLLMLFWVFAIFWLISDMVDRKPLIGVVIVCGLYCVGMFAPRVYCLNRGLQYLLFFYMGFLIRKCDLGNKMFHTIPSSVYLMVDAVLFALCEFCSGRKSMIFKLVLFGLSVILHMIGAIGAFVLLPRFVNRFLQGNKAINFFSQHSMVIYLVHQQLIYFSIGWFNGIVPPVILVLINFVFSFTVSTIFAVLMSKTKITRFLVGGKRNIHR